MAETPALDDIAIEYARWTGTPTIPPGGGDGTSHKPQADHKPGSGTYTYPDVAGGAIRRGLRRIGEAALAVASGTGTGSGAGRGSGVGSGAGSAALVATGAAERGRRGAGGDPFPAGLGADR